MNGDAAFSVTRDGQDVLHCGMCFWLGKADVQPDDQVLIFLGDRESNFRARRLVHE